MRTLVVGMLLVAFCTATGADQAMTFHGIKLGVSLGSQFRECPKEGDIPKRVSPPDKDEKGNTIPCFYDFGLFTPAAYPRVVGFIYLFDHFQMLKDDHDNFVVPKPLPGMPTVQIRLFVPASAVLRAGTIEEVSLNYMPLESERVKEALLKKFGASHPPDKKIDPKFEEYMGVKVISRELWETGWGELFLGVTDKDVVVNATTSKLKRFEQENKKDEF
jgi:hypothetical protein